MNSLAFIFLLLLSANVLFYMGQTGRRISSTSWKIRMALSIKALTCIWCCAIRTGERSLLKDFLDFIMVLVFMNGPRQDILSKALSLKHDVNHRLYLGSPHMSDEIIGHFLRQTFDGFSDHVASVPRLLNLDAKPCTHQHARSAVKDYRKITEKARC